MSVDLKGRLLVGLIACLLVSSAAGAEELRGRVATVLDGDSLIVLDRGRRAEVRLHGIDTPEGGQPFGRLARQLTSRLATGRVVTVRVRGEDRHDRVLGEVILPDGRSLNRELVRAGYAWWFRRFSADPTLGELEAEARAARRGLWAGVDPIPPWEWRDRQRRSGGSPAGPAPIIGNRRSGIYHRPDCPDYGGVASRNRVVFQSGEEAERAGYRVAGNCPRR